MGLLSPGSSITTPLTVRLGELGQTEGGPFAIRAHMIGFNGLGIDTM